MNVPPILVRGWHLGQCNTLCHLPWEATVMNQLGKNLAAVRFLLRFHSCLHEMKTQTASISISISLSRNIGVVRFWQEQEYLSTLRWKNSSHRMASPLQFISSHLYVPSEQHNAISPLFSIWLKISFKMYHEEKYVTIMHSFKVILRQIKIIWGIILHAAVRSES